MAIGGGGGGGGGGVKKESNSTTPGGFLGVNPSRESNGVRLLATNGQNRRDEAETTVKIHNKNPSLGASSFLNSKGGVVIHKTGAVGGKVENKEHVPGVSTVRGSVTKNPRFMSKKLYGSQGDRGDDLIAVKRGVHCVAPEPPTKKAKFDESDWGSATALREISDHFILGNGKVANIVPLTESNSWITERSHFNTYCKEYSQSTQEDSKDTPPPPDWLKGGKRLSIQMKPRRIKTLSFVGTSNPLQAQQPQLNESSNKLPVAASADPIQQLNESSNKLPVATAANPFQHGVANGMSSAGSCSHSNLQLSNHKIFVCQCERSTYDKRITDLAQGSIARNICIPGSIEETETMTEGARKSLSGIIKSITRSHDNGMCYFGRFSLRNFLCNETGDVKLDDVQPVTVTTEGIKQDKKRAAAVIRTEYFLGRVVPAGIESLLLLLEGEDTKNTELIKKHSWVQAPLKKLALCEFMYRNLISIKGQDLKRYRAILNEVERKVNCKGWKGPAKLNNHLNKVLQYKNPSTNQPTNYDESAEGLLHYTYNSIKHLIDHAYEDGVLQYEDHEINDVISGTFAGIIEAFQEAMFHHGRLFKLN